MANSRSARKRIRANERKHLRNRAVRSAVRTKVGKARRALVGLDETLDAQQSLITAIAALDKASEKGILHRRNAARRKSRLMAMAHRIEAATQQGDDALTAARTQALGGEKGRKASAGARARAAAAVPVAAAPAPAATETETPVAPKPAARATRSKPPVDAAAAGAKPKRARKA